MKTREAARKNEWKARDRARSYGLAKRSIVGPDRPRLYAAIIAIYRACPKGWEVDHIVPLACGGPHHPSNLRIIPMEENRRKGARIMESDV